MGGIVLSVDEVLRWDADAVRRVFHIGRARADAAFDAADGLDALAVFSSWGGDAAVAARSSVGRTRTDLDDHGNEVMVVANAARKAADDIEKVQKNLRDLIGEAQEAELSIDQKANRVNFGDRVENPLVALVRKLDIQPRLDRLVAEADSIDDTLATAVNMSDGLTVAPETDGSAADHPDQAGSRVRNQIDAFTEVFHHPPVTALDWETAAALDPHSHDDRNQGVDATVVVGRINPVPGQGVVRTNLFIPSETVLDPTLNRWPPVYHNGGDERGFDGSAGPERSRVSFLIDYENGLVVARQNPSTNTTTNEVRTGHPNVTVTQRPNGAVFIHYAAADPFSPGGEGIAKNTVCVRGDIAVQPGDGAARNLRFGGDITTFPALEVYHDSPPTEPTGKPSTQPVVRMWPGVTNSFGPVLGLPWMRPVGDPRVVAPFLATDWLGRTHLGPAAHPPTVKVVG